MSLYGRKVQAQYSSTDIYEATLDKGGKVAFPALKEVVEKIDVEKGEIFLNKSRFSEVALYED